MERFIFMQGCDDMILLFWVHYVIWKGHALRYVLSELYTT